MSSTGRAGLHRQVQAWVRWCAGMPRLPVRITWRGSSSWAGPVWWDVDRGVVTIDVAAAGVAAGGVVDLLTPAGRREWLVLAGVGAHAAARAWASSWAGPRVAEWPREVEVAAAVLESVRAEYRHLQVRPQDRPLLQAAALGVPLPSPGPGGAQRRWWACAMLTLTAGRVDAGVLPAEAVEPLLGDLEGLAGVGAVDRLRQVWVAVLAVDDDDAEAMRQLARRWADVALEEPRSATTEHDEHDEHDEREGESPEEDRQTSAGADDAAADTGDDGDDGLGDDSAAGSSNSTDSDVDQADQESQESQGGTPDPDDTRATASAGDTDAASDAAVEAAQRALQQITTALTTTALNQLAIDDDTTPEPGTPSPPDDPAGPGALGSRDAAGPFSTTRAAPQTLRTREPTTQERILAARLAQSLTRARFRSRTLTTVPSAVPPGRLDGREVLLRNAQQALGLPVTATPFRTLQWSTASRPPLSVGLMFDASGSMEWSARLQATTAWCLAQAVVQVGGRCASVVYDDQVWPLVRPGQRPTQVTTYVCAGTQENFTGAFDALDSALHLMTGRGVRLLVVLSDGIYHPPQGAAAHRVIPEFVRRGGIVLWATGDGEAIVPPRAHRLVLDPSGPSSAGPQYPVCPVCADGRDCPTHRDELPAHLLALPATIEAALHTALAAAK